MPMLDIPNRARELGRIRAGEKGVSKAGKSYPKRLETWRLTSPARDYLVAAADQYGGTVAEWTDAPTEGDQWQLTTSVDTLDVLVPPLNLTDSISQWWEMWSGGGCDRRCTGRAETVNGTPCQCPADIAERMKLAGENPPKACKPTTRVTLVLPRLPDLGVWRLEARGLNAAMEMPGVIAMLQRFAGQDVWVPARLRLDQRTAKRDGETHHFSVPVIEVPSASFGALLPGQPPGGSQLGGSAKSLPPGASDATETHAVVVASASAGAHPIPSSTRHAEPGPFTRVIRTRARTLHIPESVLAEVVLELTGQPDLNAIHNPDHVNAVIAELPKVADQLRAAAEATA